MILVWRCHWLMPRGTRIRSYLGTGIGCYLGSLRDDLTLALALAATFQRQCMILRRRWHEPLCPAPVYDLTLALALARVLHISTWGLPLYCALLLKACSAGLATATATLKNYLKSHPVRGSHELHIQIFGESWSFRCLLLERCTLPTGVGP